MNEYDFTLKFSFQDSSIEAENYLEKLAEAGCDDAIIGIGQKGRIALQFCREAENAFDAVISGIKAVRSVIPDAKLIEATPDLVGLSDIAELTGSTRQNMRKLMLTHSHTFPTPVHAGKSYIWHLFNILEWLEVQQNKIVEPAIREIALANMQINIAKETANLDKKYQAKLAALSL